MSSVNPFLRLTNVTNAWVEIRNIRPAGPRFKPGVTLLGLIKGRKNGGRYHELMKEARAGDVVIHINEPTRGHKYISGASIIERGAVRKGEHYLVALRDAFWLSPTDRIPISEFLKKHTKAIRKEITSRPRNYPFILRKEVNSQSKRFVLAERYFKKLTPTLATLILSELEGLIKVQKEEEFRAEFESSVADALNLDSDELRRRALDMPARPQRVLRTIYAFDRNPYVVAEVLRRAKLNGCEAEYCINRLPFLRSDGSPFLEVHHILSLAQGGPRHHRKRNSTMPELS
jgi:hypothetical protein